MGMPTLLYELPPRPLQTLSDGQVVKLRAEQLLQPISTQHEVRPMVLNSDLGTKHSGRDIRVACASGLNLSSFGGQGKVGVESEGGTVVSRKWVTTSHASLFAN